MEGETHAGVVTSTEEGTTSPADLPPPPPPQPDIPKTIKNPAAIRENKKIAFAILFIIYTILYR